MYSSSHVSPALVLTIDAVDILLFGIFWNDQAIITDKSFAVLATNATNLMSAANIQITIPVLTSLSVQNTKLKLLVFERKHTELKQRRRRCHR